MSARTYAVGLPVWVTVFDDGHVTWNVDRSETAEAIRESGTETVQEDGKPASDAQVDEDARRVEEWLDRPGDPPN